MSSDIRIKLSDFDAELLANIAEREGRTPEAVVLEALHELFSERLEEKSFLISKDEFEACLAILSAPARKAAAADCRLTDDTQDSHLPAASRLRRPLAAPIHPRPSRQRMRTVFFFVSKQS